ncbi:hypothetical protein SCHPADRAFT_899782 [Schizopora paradoxa]|uniref:DNA repair and recombination protein RAD54B n=1 Tax=Schizopora paradoxa TaxID=27342 RepID=A0A0H2S2Z1_9AGAM|nr:hypothetical protein SCHPADRAFT_899782 [Schizopora paradoxa]
MPSYAPLVPDGGQKRQAPSEFGGSNVPSKRPSLGSASNTHRTSGESGSNSTKRGEQYWMVQWRMPQYKKHKTWDGDGVLVLSGGKGTLFDLEGKILCTGKPNPDGACIGTMLMMQGREMEVDCAVSRDEYLSGRVFGRGGLSTTAPDNSGPPTSVSSSKLTKKFVPLRPVTNNAPLQRQQGASGTSIPKPRQGVELELVDLVNSSTKASRKDASIKTHWIAHWRRPQGRKHKTWDGDGFVTLKDNVLTLITDGGKYVGTSKWDGIPLFDGYECNIKGKVVGIEAQVDAKFVPKIDGWMADDGPCNDEADLEAPVISEEYFEEQSSDTLTPSLPSVTHIDAPSKTRIQPEDTQKKFVAPTNFYGKAIPKAEMPVKPRHDPNAEGAVVMKAPTEEHQKKFNIKFRPVVPVVIDPILARHLRPHQKEGVKFLYECVMGLRRHEGQGAILADEMGMGKTLQTITLVWTLLRQTPYFGAPGVGKVLIVCPVSLITNWKKEFHKWLGKDRVGVFTGDKDKSTIKQFVNTRIHEVLVIGYERLRTVIDELKYCMPKIGLVICDEGHRLKSANNKTSQMFEALDTHRRVILSGTPIQNDLSEFHAMADFCNPGLLDDYSTFKKVFETPITKSRQPGCSEKDMELGEARSAQLQAVARSFVLRRDASILKSYLPPKSEYVVFVSPSKLQKAMFTKILQPDTLSALIGGSMAKSLAMISLLTKLSNSPMLLKAALEKSKGGRNDIDEAGQAVEEALELLPHNAKLEDVSMSGKLTALSNILRYIKSETEEKCILVSHYTSTLNVLEAFCTKMKYSYLRLDGQTPQAKRQEYVDVFNKSSQSANFVFLLSSKAGGVGLNLIGASRLVLIDSDWNPSHDLQSMARIHRDGQKRHVFIYRLLTAGAIDEKIYQRQVTKLGLSDSLMGKGSSDNGGKSKSNSFTSKELRDLFTVQLQTSCHTHELLGCDCMNEADREEDGSTKSDSNDSNDVEDDEDDEEDRQAGFQSASTMKPETFTKMDKDLAKKRKAQLASLGELTHIDCLDPLAAERILDDALKAVVQSQERHEDSESLDCSVVPCGLVTFAFEKTSAMAPKENEKPDEDDEEDSED